MRGKLLPVFVFLLGLSCSVSAQNAKSILQSATKTMGDVKSIQYSGTGHLGTLGQAYSPTSPWPENNITAYTRTIDYDSRSAKEDLTQVEPTPIRRGGAAPFAGEQKQVNLVSSQYAWNQPGNAPQPAIGAAEERQMQIWLTPHGFLKAAMESNATAKKGNGGTVVSFMDGKFKVNGTINNQGLVTKTETWLPNTVVGDMPVETTFSNYRDFNGVKFPATIVQKQGGYPVMDLAVTDARANVDLNLPVPDAVRAAKLPPVNVASQKMADGVWFMGGGTHNSVLIEYPNYLVMIEAPNNDARSMALIAESKKLVPNKPIKYVINTHQHFDHSGGLRAYVAEGAIVVTHQINKSYYEKIWATPHTIAPDRLSQHPKKPKFETVDDKKIMTDGNHVIELYHQQNFGHNDGMLLVYLPKEKVLLEADGFNPPAQTLMRTPASINPQSVNLEDNIERLKLDVERIIPVHYPADNRKVMDKELLIAVGKGN